MSHSFTILLLQRNITTQAFAICRLPTASLHLPLPCAFTCTNPRWSIGGAKAGSDNTDALPPFYLFSFSSISNSLSSFCQYEALKYLSFPFHVVFKSSKLIPVMVMGYVINRKVYKRIEYIASVCISFGIYIFLQGGGQSTSVRVLLRHLLPLWVVAIPQWKQNAICKYRNNINDLVCLFDAFTSNWQSKLFKKHKVSKMQLMIELILSALFIFISITSSVKWRGDCFFPNHEKNTPFVANTYIGSGSVFHISHN